MLGTCNTRATARQTVNVHVFSVERKKKIVIKMPKFATEIAELVTARVTILNIWHFVQKLIIYINI